MSDSRRLRVSVAPDGTINVETLGLNGPECMDQISVMEQLLDAVTVQSNFTDDYYRDHAVSERVQNDELQQG